MGLSSHWSLKVAENDIVRRTAYDLLLAYGNYVLVFNVS